jgi:hypothetical protein
VKNLTTDSNKLFEPPALLILLSIPAALLYMVIYNLVDGSSALDIFLQQNSPMFGVTDMREYRYVISLMPVFFLTASMSYWGGKCLLQNRLMRLVVAFVVAVLITWASYNIIGMLDFAFNFSR